MRPLVLFLLLGTPWLLLTACGDTPEDPTDPCKGVVCPRGHDCVKGKCVEREDPEPEGCQSNADCLFHPAGELCDRQTRECVACFTHAHCPDGRTCQAGRCMGTVCSTDDDCGADAPYCNTAGTACLACLKDEHCEGEESCVDGVCEPPPPACVVDEDCEDEGAPFCVGGSCVACAQDEHCGEGEACAQDGSCQSTACEDNEDCAVFPGTSCRHDTCLPGDCDVAADCQDPERPYCVDNACLKCTETEGCGTGEICVDGTTCAPMLCEGLDDCPVGSICDDGGCRPTDVCTDADDCLDPRAPNCVDGFCAACGSNLDCGPWEQCRDGGCRPFATCADDGDCNGGFVCEEGACVACRNDNQCPRGVCLDGVCADAAACTSDAQCAKGVCVQGSCAACQADADCLVGYFCEEGSCEAGPACGDGLRCPPGQVCEASTCMPADCTDDGFEPDQGPEGARPLATRTIASRSICPNDEDWFVFTANAGELIDISLLQAPGELDIALVWFSDDPERRRLERRGSEGMIAGALPPAYGSRYYVVVRSEEQVGDYALLVEPASACRDGLEPNDAPNTAQPIQPGRLYEGLRPCNLDNYLIDLPAGHRAVLYAFFEDGGLDIRPSHDGNILPGTTVTVDERGGGVAREVKSTEIDRQIVFGLLVPGGKTPPRHYGIYATVEPAALCEEGEEVFSSGDASRYRLQASTVGSELEVVTACGTFENARTYEVELDQDRRFVAELAAEFADPRIALLEASCGSDVLCHVGVEGRTFVDIAGLEAGNYVLVVGAGADEGGWYDLTVRTDAPLVPPPNDRCEEANELDLSSPVEVQGTTVGARVDFAAACEIPSPDAFYSFELTEESRVIFNMESTRPHTLVLIEDACDEPHSDQSPCWDDAQKELLLPAGSYRLGVMASSGRGADFRLGAQIVHTPENDLCANATPILPGAPIQGDTTWGHDDSDYPLGQSCTGYLLGGNDVFYAVDLAQGQTVNVTVTPSPDYDVAVYMRDSCGQGAACLVGADAGLKGEAEQLQFTAPSHGTYLIVVDGAFDGGTFEIVVD